MLTVGIDVGGTNVKAGVIDPDGAVVESLSRQTPTSSPRATEDAIADVVAELAGRHVVAAVGIGAAGFVDGTGSSVLFAPHLAWRNEPLRDAVERRTRRRVVVENDANAAAWAEWRFGAGQGEDHVVLVNLGTGIGGGIVLDGELYRGRSGLAGEFGHMVVVPGGHRCGCGNRGCWEEYAGGNALRRDARELTAANSPVAHDLLARAGGDPDAVTGPLVTEAARDGDPAATELLQDMGRWLGIGLANLAAALDPGVFVIGGGVSGAGDLLLEPARDAFRRSLTGRGFRPEARIVRTSLGVNAGMIGAADLARASARLFGRSGRVSRRRPRRVDRPRRTAR